MELERLDWYGCYDGGWQSAPLVAEAYAHPAKMSFGLAERIYRHMLAEGWLRPGDQVLDPFGGIGGCAFHAALYGLHWTGVELEEKFVGLAQQNLDLWRVRYAQHFPGYGSARILRGNSRRLAELVAAADGVVSSPPFQDRVSVQDTEFYARKCTQTGRNPNSAHAQGISTYGTTPGQLGSLPAGSFEAAVSSPPYAGNDKRDFTHDDRDAAPQGNGCFRGSYSRLAGQLGDMQTGDFAAVVSSPPYAANTVHDGNGIDPDKLTGNRPGQHSQALTMQGYTAVVSSPPYSGAGDGLGHDAGCVRLDANEDTRREREGTARRPAYGATAGQLGAMSAGEFDAAVSSPPYERSMDTAEDHSARAERTGGFTQGMQDTRYGQNPHTFLSKDPSGLNNQQRHEIAATNPQVGALDADTFWAASREIVAQTYTVLRPGAVAAWVTGDFVRNKQRVPFGAQWLALCESVGFVPVAWAVAWKTADHGAQLGLLAEDKPLRHDKVSFFRRLANASNPDAAILNEDVIFVRKED